MSQSSISELENGNRKNVTVAEVVVLAKALDTAPLCLIYPGPYNDVIEVLPGVEGLELWAAQWFSGLFPALTDSDEPEQGDAYRRNTRALADARTIIELRQRSGNSQQV